MDSSDTANGTVLERANPSAVEAGSTQVFAGSQKRSKLTPLQRIYLLLKCRIACRILLDYVDRPSPVLSHFAAFSD
jgi:hypothetical protein